MSPGKAKMIGRIQTLKGGMAGVLIAYLLVCVIGGPFWVFKGLVGCGVLIGFLTFLGWIYLIGGEVGYFIIIKRWHSLTALAGSFVIVWLSATIAGMVVGFGESDSLYNYVWKLICAFTIFGGIPIVVLGVLVGITIESKGNSAR